MRKCWAVWAILYRSCRAAERGEEAMGDSRRGRKKRAGHLFPFSSVTESGLPTFPSPSCDVGRVKGRNNTS
jgi:hypothetical protein